MILCSAGLVPRPMFVTCSHVWRGRYEDAVASGTATCGLDVLAVRAIYDLQSADWCCNLRLAYQTAFGLYPLLFYKESTLFLGFYSGFTSGEYRIALVDFIVALRRTKGRGRRTLRSPPSPSSGLHLIHPGLTAAAGHICCRGLCQYRIPVSGAGRSSPLRYDVWLLCVRA